MTSVLLKHIDRITQTLGLPLVCKDINSDRGQKNYLLQTKEELVAILKKSQPQDRFMLQAYVPNDGYLRALVLGNKIELAIQRTTHNHLNPQKQHLNNPSGGLNAHLLPLNEIPSVARDLSIRAAKCMKRQVAGIDLIQDKVTKEWFVLEVNAAPQLRTGSFLEEKQRAFAKFIDLELER